MAALFDYQGQLQSGAEFQGTLEANSLEHARSALADMGVRVISLRQARRKPYVPPLSQADYLFFNEQVTALAQAGIPLDDGLRRVAAEVGSRRLKRALLSVAGDLERGVSLDDAVARAEIRFPGEYAGVLAAGIRTGDLGATLVSLTSSLRLRGVFAGR